MTTTTPQDRIEAEAAQWAIRLSGSPMDAATRTELDAWLAQDPDHGKVMAQAMSTWASLSGLRHQPGNLARHRLAALPPRRRWPQHLALAASIVLSVLLGASWIGDPMVALRADYRTGPGELLAVTLDDGSQIELAPESAVSVNFKSHQRQVDLLQGRVFLAPVPAHQAQGRPFVAAAAGGRAQALGTRYLLERDDTDRVAVTVIEHDVRVTAPNGSTATLSPGQSVRYDTTSGLGAINPANIRQATAWRDGRLIFDRVPLSQVVEELNRYRHGHIAVWSDDLAERRVSGVFDTARLDDALDSIAAEMGARTTTLPPFVTVLY